MSQLLSGRHRGRFAAPPEKRDPWWKPAPVYALLALAAITLVFDVMLFFGYSSCADEGTELCVSTRLLQSSTGSYTGILAVSGTVGLAGVVSAVASRLLLGRRNFLVSWALAGASLAALAGTYGILSGLVPTPWGELLPGTAR